MPSSKFVVLKLKDIIKAVIFIAIAAALILTLIIFLGKAGSRQCLYSPGTYSSVITFGSESVTVSVTVDKHSIEAVNVSEPSEAVAVFYPLFPSAAESVGRKVVETQGLDIALSEENPVTEALILDAVGQCLESAKK